MKRQGAKGAKNAKEEEIEEKSSGGADDALNAVA